MKRPRVFKLRCYAGEDDDLLAWLATLDNQPYGRKSQAVKAALRRGLATAPAGVGERVPPPLDADMLLSEIRRIMEAVVSSARHGLQVAPPAPAANLDETEDLLAALDTNLLLEDKDEEI